MGYIVCEAGRELCYGYIACMCVRVCMLWGHVCVSVCACCGDMDIQAVVPVEGPPF